MRMGQEPRKHARGIHDITTSLNSMVIMSNSSTAGEGADIERLTAHAEAELELSDDCRHRRQGIRRVRNG
jgi:hypothetical protein